MRYLEVIQRFGKLTTAQTSANAFYIGCNQDDKSINYEHASASVFIDALTTEEVLLLQESLIDDTNYSIYPHGNQIEIWFF